MWDFLTGECSDPSLPADALLSNDQEFFNRSIQSCPRRVTPYFFLVQSHVVDLVVTKTEAAQSDRTALIQDNIGKVRNVGWHRQYFLAGCYTIKSHIIYPGINA